MTCCGSTQMAHMAQIAQIAKKSFIVCVALQCTCQNLATFEALGLRCQVILRRYDMRICCTTKSA